MTPFLKKVSFYIVLISVSLLFLLSTMAAPLVTTGADFSVYNPGWNGCSDLAVESYEAGTFTPNLRLENGEQVEIEQKDISSYDVPARISAFVFIGPDADFSSSEADHVHQFLMEGGTVLLADDFGTGDTLLDGLNTSSRFLDKPILDLSFDKKPHFGIAYDIADHEITEGVSFVMTNKPTGISPGENSSVLMRTSSASWLDTNENQQQDPGEDQKEHPILTIEDYGQGELVLLSDPSIMINSMNERLDNDILIANLIDHISEGRKNIIFDESHRDMNLLFDLVYTLRYPSKGISMLVITVPLGITAFIFVPDLKKKLYSGIKHILQFLRKGEEEERLVEKVLNNHPDWDEHKLKTIHRRMKKES